jgi:hypothetical protein
LIFHEKFDDLIGEPIKGDDVEHIWIPKAVGIVSQCPYFELFSNILVDFWACLYNEAEPEVNLAQAFIRQLIDVPPPNHPGLTLQYAFKSKMLKKSDCFGFSAREFDKAVENKSDSPVKVSVQTEN